MDSTTEVTHELRRADPATATDAPTPDEPDQYRVVLDWRDSPSVASVPITDRRTALAAFDRAVTSYAAEIADGRLSVRVLTEDVWAARATRPSSTAGR